MRAETATRAALLLLATFPLSAADPATLKRDCFTRAGFSGNGAHWVENCVTDVFTLRPVHLVLESLGPGSGFAAGLGFDSSPNSDRIQKTYSFKAAHGLTDASFEASGSFGLAFPGLSFGKSSTSRNAPLGFSTHPYGRRIALQWDDPEVDAKASLSIRAQRLEVLTQDFYGLGQFTTQSGWARYSLRRSTVGAVLADPLASWLTGSVSVDYIKPDIGNISGQPRPTIGLLYSEASAPGLTGRPSFLRIQPAAHARFKVGKAGISTARFSLMPPRANLGAEYSFYRDLDTGHYSFRQLHLRADTSAQIRIDTGHTASNRKNLLAKALCPSVQDKECTPGTLYLSSDAVFSQVPGPNAVPFYFQPTLGGADAQGEDTLRGYRDFRFRASDRLLYRAEFQHDFNKFPLGVATFYDIGRVGASISDLTAHFRHDIGLGVYAKVQGVTVLRIYVAFGSREGVRPNVKGPGGIF